MISEYGVEAWIHLDHDDLFEVLAQEKDVANIINPFINAHKRGASEQLEGQLGSLNQHCSYPSITI